MSFVRATPSGVDMRLEIMLESAFLSPLTAAPAACFRASPPPADTVLSRFLPSVVSSKAVILSMLPRILPPCGEESNARAIFSISFPIVILLSQRALKPCAVLSFHALGKGDNTIYAAPRLKVCKYLFMKIIIFSDSHGNVGEMLDILEKTQPDCVVHLGDNYRDAEKIIKYNTGLPVYAVKGNCDYDDAPEESIEIIGGKRFLLCHGHRYGVKTGYQRLYAAAVRAGVDAAICGHTHTACCHYTDGIYIINPGAMERSRAGSYAVVEILDRDMLVNIIKI